MGRYEQLETMQAEYMKPVEGDEALIVKVAGIGGRSFISLKGSVFSDVAKLIQKWSMEERDGAQTFSDITRFDGETIGVDRHLMVNLTSKILKKLRTVSIYRDSSSSHTSRAGNETTRR